MAPIQTNNIFPPIPMRCFDWCAYRDPEPGHLMGYGRTEQEAINEQEEDDREAQSGY